MKLGIIDIGSLTHGRCGKFGMHSFRDVMPSAVSDCSSYSHVGDNQPNLCCRGRAVGDQRLRPCCLLHRWEAGAWAFRIRIRMGRIPVALFKRRASGAIQGQSVRYAPQFGNSAQWP